MMKTMKTLKGLLALLVSLAMTMALGVSLLASAAEDAATETVVVTQVITENTTPQRTSYTYVLTPKKAENPMPEGTKDGKYTVGSIDGATTDANAPTFTLAIDATKPGVYEYVLERTETTPEGDTVSPTSHIFGYKVEVDEKTGELVVIPYICQSGEPVFSDPDENGYPTKLTLPNTITGKENTTKSTTSTTKRTVSTSTRTVTTGRNTRGTTATNGTKGTVARFVNTGDPYQIGLWIGLLALAAGAMVIIGIVKRKKESDDEEDF